MRPECCDRHSAALAMSRTAIATWVEPSDHAFSPAARQPFINIRPAPQAPDLNQGAAATAAATGSRARGRSPGAGGRALPARRGRGRPGARLWSGRPAGSAPGKPAALRDRGLRMKVPKVGTGTPLSSTVSSSPIFAAGSGRRREHHGATTALSEVAAISLLQRRAMVTKLPPDKWPRETAPARPRRRAQLPRPGRFTCASTRPGRSTSPGRVLEG